MATTIRKTRYRSTSGQRYTQKESGTSKRIVQENGNSSAITSVAIGVAAFLLGGPPGIAAAGVAATLFKRDKER